MPRIVPEMVDCGASTVFTPVVAVLAVTVTIGAVDGVGDEFE